MDYGEIITRAWRIVWKNKFLWILGFFAALTRVGGNASNSYQGGSGSGGGGNVSPEQVAAIGAAVAAIACIGFILVIAFALLATTARGGLIAAAWQLDDGDTVTFREAFRAGTGALWRMVGVYILLYLPFILFGAVIAGVVFFAIGGAAFFSSVGSGDEAAAGVILIAVATICGLVCLMVPLNIFLQFITAFSVRGTVIRNLGVTDSIVHGWHVVRDNLTSIFVLSVLFSLIMMAVGMASAVVLVPIVIVGMAPTIGGIMAGNEIGVSSILWLSFVGMSMAVVGAALNSVFIAWQSTTFTLAYKEFTAKAKVMEDELAW